MNKLPKTYILTPIHMLKSKCCESSVDRDIRLLSMYVCKSCKKECNVEINDTETEQYILGKPNKTIITINVTESTNQ